MTAHESDGSVWSSLARLLALLVALFMLLIAVGLAVIRLAYPMPRLLYRTNDEIRLRELRCDSLFAPCVPVDRALLDHLDSVDSMAQASPDGTLIAIRFAADWRLYPTDCLLASSTCPGQPMGVPAKTMRLAWGPQSASLVYLLGGGDKLRVLTRGCLPGQTGNCTQTEVTTGLNGVHTPTWSADGTLLALSGPPKGLLLLDAACLNAPATCLLTPYRAVDPVQYWWATLSHDGKRVLYQEDGR